MTKDAAPAACHANRRRADGHLGATGGKQSAAETIHPLTEAHA